MADDKKKKKKKAPPVLTPEERRALAEKQVIGAGMALDFRDQAHFYNRAAELLEGIPDDPEGAARAAEYRAKAEEISKDGWEAAYQAAVADKEAAVTAEEFSQAESAFHKLPGADLVHEKYLDDLPSQFLPGLQYGVHHAVIIGTERFGGNDHVVKGPLFQSLFDIRIGAVILRRIQKVKSMFQSIADHARPLLLRQRQLAGPHGKDAEAGDTDRNPCIS